MQGCNLCKGCGTAGKRNHSQSQLQYSVTSRHSYLGSFISCTRGVLFPDYEPLRFCMCNLYFSRAKENIFSGVFYVLHVTHIRLPNEFTRVKL